MNDDDERLAGLRVLRHLVWIDGRVDPIERDALQRFAGVDAAALDAALADPIPLDDAIAAVEDPEVRHAVLKTARWIAHEHRSQNDDESFVARVRDAWGLEKHFDDPDALRGRDTDISELSRRFTHGEASAKELARKIRDDLGED
ncbi:MAG: hypothetical protein H6719_25570 [Sandaracinaceae bacterium]|nr:hypothetical protein [Sandaracinaceae bacterium]